MDEMYYFHRFRSNNYRGGFRISLRGVRDFAREARAIFFRTPLSNFRTPLRASQGGAKIAQGGAKKKIAHAKLAQGGAKLANGGGADKHSSIDIILL